jgi:hypothetical protein
MVMVKRSLDAAKAISAGNSSSLIASVSIHSSARRKRRSCAEL